MSRLLESGSEPFNPLLALRDSQESRTNKKRVFAECTITGPIMTRPNGTWDLGSVMSGIGTLARLVPEPVLAQLANGRSKFC